LLFQLHFNTFKTPLIKGDKGLATELEIIAPEDIRSEKQTFKEMIIGCLNRIHIISSMFAKENTRASMRALEESIAYLHCFLAPYYGKDYEEKSRLIQASLEEERGIKDFQKFIYLRQWLALICRNLGKVGLLPPIDVIYDMSTPDQIMEEEKHEFLRIMRKFIKNNKREEIVQWIKQNGIIEKKKIVIERPKIEDVIDAVYLPKEKEE